jgi:hypothetical protein
VPRQSKPVSPIVPFIPMKTDHSNVLIWHLLQSQSPVPFFFPLDTRQNLVSVDTEYSICTSPVTAFIKHLAVFVLRQRPRAVLTWLPTQRTMALRKVVFDNVGGR